MKFPLLDRILIWIISVSAVSDLVMIGIWTTALHHQLSQRWLLQLADGSSVIMLIAVGIYFLVTLCRLTSFLLARIIR